jgi:hypothetical protein
MASLSEILSVVQQIHQDLPVLIQRARVSPQQVVLVEGLADLSKRLGLIQAGEFRAGNDKEPGFGFTGGRFGYPGFVYDGTTYFLAGVENDVIQVGMSLTSGKIIAGGGDIILDSEGISVENTAATSGIQFKDNAGNRTTIHIVADALNDLEIVNIAESPDGLISFFLKIGGSNVPVFRLTTTRAYINPNAEDVDFSIGSNADPSFLLLNAGTETLDIGDTFFVDGTLRRVEFKNVANQAVHIIDPASTTHFNEPGLDVDFKVEGDTDGNLFWVDAGLDAIGMGGTAESGYKLKVHGKTNLASGNTYDINGTPHTHTNQTTEEIQDIVGAMVTDGAHQGVNATYDDALGTVSFDGRPGTIGAIPNDGWIDTGDTWTYASADDPVYQVYVGGNVTANANYKLGNKVKCTNNSTTFYGFIVKVGAYDGGNNRTPVDLYGGTDYDLANSAITAPNITKVKSPDGFPMNPEKWTISTSDTTQRTQSTPTQNTWYNPGTISLNIPIGAWRVSYRCFAQVVSNAAQTAATCFSTLSTANNSESDPEFTGGTQVGGASGTIISGAPVFSLKTLVLTAKTTYYLNIRTTLASMASIHSRNDLSKLSIFCVCAYL